MGRVFSSPKIPADEENTTRNLVPRVLVGEWMREAVERLYGRQPDLAGAVAADLRSEVAARG